MMINQDIKTLVILLILVGFTLSLVVFVSLFNNPIQNDTEDLQDDIIPQHYNLEFIDHSDHIICNTMILFQITQNRYQFSIVKSNDHLLDISSVSVYQKQRIISIQLHIENNRIIIKNHRWKNIFYIGNYSISLRTYVNISNTIKSDFIRQFWSSKYRILFPTNHFFPYLSHSFYQSTFNVNIITTDDIISNLPLNQISSPLDISHLTFALLHQYECRSMDILQICLPKNLFYDIDLYSYIFNFTLNTIQIFESHFSQVFPLNNLTLITVLELNQRIISKPGLILMDQNVLLTNTSAEQIIHQHELIFFIIAYQWIDRLIQFKRTHQWIGKSLARSIATYLFSKIYDSNDNNNSQIERFMSTVVMDSLCDDDELFKESNNIKFENIVIEKGEAFLREYRLYIGDHQFHSRIQQLIEFSNSSLVNESVLLAILFPDLSSFLTWLKLPGHPIVFLNSSTIDIHLFKFNSNCSTISYDPSLINYLQISSNISLNPFIHIFYSSWNVLINDIKTFRQPSLSKLLFDSFLFNLANQLSIDYPLQFLHLFFQQSFSMLTKHDLIFIKKILQWYRSMLSNILEEKFVNFLRKSLNPFCLNHLWTRQILIDRTYYNQQIINDILLELCCSINHSICLQQISNRNEPQILLQFLFNHQRFDSSTTKSIIYLNQTDMLTSFNQLQIPSVFIYPDRIITNLVCQIVRQQNDKYWYDLIHVIEQKFQYQLIPSAIITGMSCAIRTVEQVDFYFNHLCPLSPFKWPCYRDILTYSSIKNFQQLETIDEEQWPINTDELVDFFFHSNFIQGNFSSSSIMREFQSFVSTWLITNEDKFLHWLDNENN